VHAADLVSLNLLGSVRCGKSRLLAARGLLWPQAYSHCGGEIASQNSRSVWLRPQPRPTESETIQDTPGGRAPGQEELQLRERLKASSALWIPSCLSRLYHYEKGGGLARKTDRWVVPTEPRQ